jgi:acetyltransferase-like isoleucine patch superfamily enzyme
MEHFEKIGKDCKIEANNLIAGTGVIIGDNVNISCENFKIGNNCIIGNNVTINCHTFDCDDWLFMADGVEIGRGGCNGPNSKVKIGKHVGIFENTIINPSEEVTIGNDVGIGADVMIWTHGAWLDVMKGFPADFGPVSIGNDVWLPARSIVLPNVEIGNDIVIGIGSIINRDLPSGCFAAGSPCKVIKKDCYPVDLSDEEKFNILSSICKDWIELMKFKGVYAGLLVEPDKIVLDRGKETVFDIENRTIEGFEDEVSEDFRDYLRRRGVKIFTKKLFKSI